MDEEEESPEPDISESETDDPESEPSEEEESPEPVVPEPEYVDSFREGGSPAGGEHPRHSPCAREVRNSSGAG